MVYIYKKKVGSRTYYYLRASITKGKTLVTKDIAYLGNNLEEVKKQIKNIPSKYTKEIRKTYKTINKFIVSNHYLEKIKENKLKKDKYLTKDQLENIEAMKLHWGSSFQKLNELTQEEILNNFIIDFAYNTASIEGNTVTLKEAQRLLNDNLTPKNRTLREIYDLQNTKEVFFELFKSNKRISNKLVVDVHKKLMDRIDNRIGYRSKDVRILKMNFKSTPAPFVLTDMKLLLDLYLKSKLHPFVLALVFHHKFEKIHPFMDGNGRTGRMLMNYILLLNGYPPLVIRRRNRLKYIDALNKADKTGFRVDLKDYSKLIAFVYKEYKDNYWNLFL